MNLKDRGITVGDLLILLIITISTTFLVKAINKDKKTSFNYIKQENINYKKDSLSKYSFSKFSV